MINTVSSNFPNIDQMKAAVPAEAKTPETMKASAESRIADKAAPAVTVEISEAAQVKLLKSQGQSATLIASSLGISTDAVNQYLGLTSKET